LLATAVRSPRSIGSSISSNVLGEGLSIACASRMSTMKNSTSSLCFFQIAVSRPAD
jgi:hypothetical protein